MKKAVFYLQEEKVIYQIAETRIEKGDFNISEVETFLGKNKVDIINVIVSKPQLLFRKMELPFRNRRKIYIVLPSEIEETLPEDIGNFLFSLDFFYTDKNRTIVNLYGIHKTIFEFWTNLAKKYRAKIFFFADAILFHNFLKQYTDEKDYISIYKEGEYILLNITEGGILTGSYSWTFTPSERTVNIALIKGILEEKKNFPVFVFGDIKKDIDIEEYRLRDMSLPSGIENRYLFHTISSLRRVRKRFISLVLSQKRKIPVANLVFLCIFLIFSFLSFSPYLKIPNRQKELEGIGNEMKQIFISTFPDVQNIINPLVQAREKIMKSRVEGIKTGVPSVLHLMAEITKLFPENIDAGLDLFRVAGDTITISGTTDSLATFEVIKERIENSSIFAIAGIGTISFDAKGRVVFSMTLKVNELWIRKR